MIVPVFVLPSTAFARPAASTPTLTTDCAHLVTPWVALYQDSNFGGRELCFEGTGLINLVDYGFNGQTRSINIAATGSFYALPDGAGDQLPFYSGDEQADLGAWDNQISSFIVTGGSSPQPDGTQNPPFFCIGGGSCNGTPSGNTGKPLPPSNNEQVKELVGLVGNIVSASDKICSVFKCKASVAVPISLLNKLDTIGNLGLATVQVGILSQKLAALNEALKQFGRHSHQACVAAQAAYDANKNLHETLLNVVPGLELIFPLPAGDGPICG
jgi:hypothetical protein